MNLDEMAQDLHDRFDLRMHARLEQSGRIGMPQVVEADGWESEPLN